MTAPRRPASPSLPAAPAPPMSARRRPADLRAARRAARFPGAGRGGFTLLEMLIAVTLTLLMMALFAEVFSLASETVTTRKGMAANDQKSRLLADRIKKDLDARTIGTVAPFAGSTLTYDLLRADPANLADTGPAFQDNPSNPVVGWRPRQAFDEDENRLVFLNPGLTQPLWEARPQQVSDEGDRQGFLSISENDPDDDADDVISFMIDRRRRQARGNHDFSPARGRAALIFSDGGSPPTTGLLTAAGNVVIADQPATDVYTAGGAEAGEAFASSVFRDLAHPQVGGPTGAAATVLSGTEPVGESYFENVTLFLRDGNLVLKRKLVREPPTSSDALFDTDADTNSNNWPPPGLDSFGRFFDYAAYRHPAADPLSGAGTNLGPQFHSEASLQNRSRADLLTADYDGDGFDEIRLPIALGNPYLRDGAGALPFRLSDVNALKSFGRPREFSTKITGPSTFFADPANAVGLVDLEWARHPSSRSGPAFFLGRYLPQEEARRSFHLPGRQSPAGAAFNALFAPDLLNLGGNLADWYESPTRPRRRADARRGEEILAANVHAFDVEVYDDAIGDFVDLGHQRTVAAPDLYDVPGGTAGDVGEPLQVAGDYHADRLIARNPGGGPAMDIDGDGVPELDFTGDGNPDPHPFGNRFDTWHPAMTLMGVGYVDDPASPGNPKAIAVERPYPPPYRPLRNPLGGDVGVPTRDFNGNLITADLSFSGQGLRYVADAGTSDNARLGGRRPVTTEAIYQAQGNNDAAVFFNPSTPYFKAPGEESYDDDGIAFGPRNLALDLAGGAATVQSVSDFVEGRRQSDATPVLFPDPNEYGAFGSDDEKPLRALKITVRYYDVQSDRMREESFRHNLLN